jgi:hypothetical protein
VATEDPHASESGKLSADAGIDQASLASSDSMSAKGKARRRFARAGAGATGVLLTLHSQPGMACTYCGISISGAVSAIGQHRTVGMLSHHGPAPMCNGRLPRDWLNLTWPKGAAPTDPFRKYFSCSGQSPYHGLSCKEVLQGSEKDPTRMGQYLMASYLNVQSRRINFLTVASLQEVWNDWSAKGYYSPMAGQRWFASDIVGYLYGTMD